LQIGTHEFTFARDEVSRGTHLDVAAKKFSAEQTLELEPKVKKKGLSFVQIQSGEYIGRIMPLQENITHLGKAGGNRVVITRRVDNYYLSQVDGDKVTINGLPVGMESILLRNGDLVQIGAIRCQFFN